MAEKRSSGSSAKLIAIAVAAVVGVILILQNTQSVPINWLFWTWETSLVVFTIIIAVLGFVAGWLIGRR